MRSFTLVLLVGIGALAAAHGAGQYYVPRAYYTIDNSGHESAPVPLRRLRRSLHTAPLLHPYGAGSGASASASANANADNYGGGDANANANARASSSGVGGGGWYPGGGVHYPGGWAGGHGHGFVQPVLGYH